MEKKKLYIKTMGCQMNVYDSQKMADIFAPLGYVTVDTPKDADFIILNTCHIREKATEKVFSDLGRLRPFKEKSDKKVILAVAGCVAQAEGDIITKRAKYVDMVFGPQVYHKLPEMVLKATNNERVINTDFPTESKFDSLPLETTGEGFSGFVAIQEGCDKFCTYCVVPYTRGAEFSRPSQQILDEAKALIDGGVKDITLLGQNVNAYKGDISFAELLAKVNDISGLERLRYITSHPTDVTQEQIDAHGELSKLMPYLHLPIQSGSNHVLELMNRKHTVEFYLDTVEKFRKSRPDIALSSDFIVGFSGETEQDHQDTLTLVEKVGYAACYSFKYSSRPGTTGALMKNLVSEDIKERRLQELQNLLLKQQTEFNQKFIGQTVEILLDRKGGKHGQLIGKTPYMQSVYINAESSMLGKTVKVKINKSTQNSLSGIIA